MHICVINSIEHTQLVCGTHSSKYVFLLFIEIWATRGVLHLFEYMYIHEVIVSCTYVCIMYRIHELLIDIARSIHIS